MGAYGYQSTPAKTGLRSRGTASLSKKGSKDPSLESPPPASSAVEACGGRRAFRRRARRACFGCLCVLPLALCALLILHFTGASRAPVCLWNGWMCEDTAAGPLPPFDDSEYGTGYDQGTCLPCDPSTLNGTLNQNRPYLYVVGAQQGGTDALRHFLLEHPDLKDAARFVYSSVLPFDHSYVDWDANTIDQCGIYRGYEALLSESASLGEDREGIKVIDETVHNLVKSDYVPQRVLCADASPKVIVVLREPVDRLFNTYDTYRNYFQDEMRPPWVLGPLGVRLGYFPSLRDDVAEERASLEAAGLLNPALTPAEEYELWKEAWPMDRYLMMGMYAVQIRQWLDVFRDRFGTDAMTEHLLILEYESMRKDVKGTYDKVAAFLGLSSHDPDVAGLERAIEETHASTYTPQTEDAAMRKELARFYAPFNKKLHKLLAPLGINISWARRA